MQYVASQARVPASSPFERDPSALPRTWISNQDIKIGADNSAAAAFWTALDNIGDYQTSSPAGGTARTVVNVSGKGSLYGLIGPQTANAAGATTTWVVTVDGVAYTFTHGSHPGGYCRSIIGTILEADGRFTTANNAGGVNLSGDLIARASNDAAMNINAAVKYQVRIPLNIPRFIRFETSLNITVALSSALGLDPLPAYAGAIWHLNT